MIYGLVLLASLKLLGVLPGSPQYEVTTAVDWILTIGLAAVGGFLEWLKRRFRRLEDAIDELTKTVRGLDKRLSVLEAKLDVARLNERVSSLEKRVEELAEE